MEKDIWSSLEVKLLPLRTCSLHFRDYMKKVIALTFVIIFSFLLIYGIFYADIISEVMSNGTIVIIQNSTRSMTLKVPAVSERGEGKGVMVDINVELKPGTGKTLVDIDQLVFWTDTQNSIRIAKLVAENITGVDMSQYDVIYSVGVDAEAIEGPSAGAAMAIATALLLENSTLNISVSITGALEPDGTITPVGGVLDKAYAVKDNNMTLFLVPEGQKIYTEKKKEKECRDSAFGEVCKIVTKEETIDVEEHVGIDVVEVSNIREALIFFR